MSYGFLTGQGGSSSGGGGGSETLTATLTAAGWTGSAAPYIQTVSVDGILATDNPIIDCNQPETGSMDILVNWGFVHHITTADGSITAYCFMEKPTEDIPIQIKVVR